MYTFTYGPMKDTMLATYEIAAVGLLFSMFLLWLSFSAFYRIKGEGDAKASEIIVAVAVMLFFTAGPGYLAYDTHAKLNAALMAGTIRTPWSAFSGATLTLMFRMT